MMWKVGDFCRYDGKQWMVKALEAGKVCIVRADDIEHGYEIWVPIARIVNAN